MNKAESVQEIVDELMPLTQLFKHIKVVPANNTVIEDEDADGIRRCYLMKCAGAVCTDEPGEKRSAVSRLLTAIDDALFLGNPDDNDSMLEGIASFAAEERIATLPHKMFFALAHQKRETMRVFHKIATGYMNEGDLPPNDKMTVCIRMDALEWHQLLPASYVPLVAMREGKPTLSYRTGQPVAFEHEDSRTVERGVIVMYGTLVLKDPSGVFVLEQE